MVMFHSCVKLPEGTRTFQQHPTLNLAEKTWKNSGQSGHGSNQFLLWRWSVLACLPISQESKAPRNQSPVKLLGDGKPGKGWNVKCRHVCETIKVWGMDYNHLVNRWNRWNRWYLSLYPHISWVYTHENPIIMVNLLLISTNHLWFLLSMDGFMAGESQIGKCYPTCCDTVMMPGSSNIIYINYI